ncbi:hypothetical protein [Oceanispirochaeta sp.]|jgi:hypothetical protein|uniref:hypothetical protein n=1 Tax=Oceanispirochaeta sp. TaxID=2035350 RepID=UPI00263440A9|nr:hypothetical protein [Oceanispirochaeta sp.]MDA3957047.1 hypothetical protein [Oceanispirochaeta sp.]
MKKMILILAVMSVLPLVLQAETEKGKEWTLSILAGEEYSYIKWLGPIPMKKKPLIAVWLEDSEGRLLRTLSVTGKAAENRWLGKAVERPESLPVYYHSKAAADIQESIDAISSASKGKEPKDRRFPGEFPAETARIRAEVNISYDYNDFYTKELTDVNGQPSLIFQSEWDSDKKEYSLKPAGIGSVDGSTAVIDADLSHMTTALKLVDSILLSW